MLCIGEELNEEKSKLEAHLISFFSEKVYIDQDMVGAVILLLLLELLTVLVLFYIASVPLEWVLFLMWLEAIVVHNLYTRSQRTDITNIFPIWIIYLESISSVYQNFTELMSDLAQRSEYGPLTEACAEIHSMAKLGSSSYTGAIQEQAAKLRNRQFKLFLLRWAKAMEVGESIQEFVARERKKSMELFSIEYSSSVSRGVFIMEGINSANFAIIFLTIAMLLMSLVQSIDLSTFIFFSALIVVMINITGSEALYALLPYDPYTFQSQERINVRNVLLGASVVFYFALIIILTFSYPVMDSFGIHPLSRKGLVVIVGSIFLVGGYIGVRDNDRVGEIEVLYESFTRDLAATATALGRSISVAVTYLVPNDRKMVYSSFGVFAPYVLGLRKRLDLGIPSKQAWKNLSIESRSVLIERFYQIFIDASFLGGDPSHIAEICSTALTQYSGLRERRKLETAPLTIQSHIFVLTMLLILAFLQAIFAILTKLDTYYGNLQVFLPLDLVTAINDLDLYILILYFILMATLSFNLGLVGGGDRLRWFIHAGMISVLFGVISLFLPSVIEAIFNPLISGGL